MRVAAAAGTEVSGWLFEGSLLAGMKGMPAQLMELPILVGRLG